MLFTALELTKQVAGFLTLRLKLMAGVALFLIGVIMLCGLVYAISKHDMWRFDFRIFTVFGFTGVPLIAGTQLIILSYKEKKIYERNN
jgi:membrane protein YdbS with pleckstrin-like domain